MLTVGRPGVFVDVGVGGEIGEILDGARAGRDVDERKTLLEEGVFDFAGFGSFGDERAGCARRVFGEEDGDRFVVWGEQRRVEETFYMREFSRCAAVCGDDVELLLIFFGGVGEKRELFAVVGPGDVAFGVECGWRVRR